MLFCDENGFELNCGCCVNEGNAGIEDDDTGVDVDAIDGAVNVGNEVDEPTVAALGRLVIGVVVAD